MSALPEFSMQQLLEAGVHFGHKTRRWNPRMAPFIFGARNDIHIIDLSKTVPLLHQALKAVNEVCGRNGRILFVGTKRQAQDPIAEAAARCGQYYINYRWLGGLLTNWRTIQHSIKTLRTLDSQLDADNSGFTKKERLKMTRERDKLELSLGGIKDMGGLPDLLFVIDTNKEDLAVAEAKKLGIPVVGIVDTNATYEDITYPVPGNDDSTRAIRLYCELIANAALSGLQKAMINSGADLGEGEQGYASSKSKPKKAEKSEAAPAASEEKEADKKRGKQKDAKKVVVEVKKSPARGKAASKQADDASADNSAEDASSEDDASETESKQQAS